MVVIDSAGNLTMGRELCSGKEGDGDDGEFKYWFHDFNVRKWGIFIHNEYNLFLAKRNR